MADRLHGRVVLFVRNLPGDAGVDLPPFLVYDERSAQRYISELASQVDRPVIEAFLGLDGIEVNVRSGQIGRTVDVDATFQGTDEWYDQVARSRPPKDKPWYHVLVHGAEHTTYVAERHLEVDPSGQPIQHPLLEQLFDRFESGRYQRTDSIN